MNIIVTDLEKCIGCHSCELACAVRWSTSGALSEAMLESPRPASRVHVLGIAKQPVPLQCQQCDDAPCASACPTKALYRAESHQPVFFRREICIGCSSCVLACPFGVLRRADGGIMAKCDLCWDDIISRERPALIITDILMPKMDGFSLVRRLRLNPSTRTIPVVFLSATYIAPEDKEFALTIGVTRFIEKPVNLDEFFPLIEELLTHERDRNQNR